MADSKSSTSTKTPKQESTNVVSGYVPSHVADTLAKDNARAAGFSELADAPGEQGQSNQGESNVTGSAAAIDDPRFSAHRDDNDRMSVDQIAKDVEKSAEATEKAKDVEREKPR